MARSKSTPVAAMLVAIINLVLFVPCLCCSGGGLVMVASGADSGAMFAADPKQKEEAKKMEAKLDAEIPNRKPISIATSLIQTVGSLLMVIAAIGLLMKQPWGRLLCMVGAAIVILYTLVNIVYQAAVVLPPTMKLQEEEMKRQNPGAAPPAGVMQAAGYITLAVMALLMAGYPLLAIVLMMTGSVREFYSGAAAARRRDGGDGDGRDYDRRDDADYRRDDDLGR